MSRRSVRGRATIITIVSPLASEPRRIQRLSDNQPEGAMHAMVADLRRIFEACANNSWRSAAFNQVSVMSQLTGGPARAADPKRLHRAYAQVYSQGGADGYLAELFRRIGMRERTFLEIGVGNGLENNTRLLLEHGWTGIWIEGDITQAKAAAELFAGHVASGALRILPLMVTRENINAALDAYGAPPAFALISIDVDINTSHIWRALDRKARVCCIEYNASVPPAAAIEVTYDPHGQWDGTNYFGAGLKVMEIIGRAKRHGPGWLRPTGNQCLFRDRGRGGRSVLRALYRRKPL